LPGEQQARGNSPSDWAAPDLGLSQAMDRDQSAI
jgi:hypothetical protein